MEGRSVLMAIKKVPDACIIKCNPQRNLVSGYTKVKVMPENYSKIVLIAGVTGKTIQEIVDELLTFAIKKAQIQQGNANPVNLNLKEGESE